LYTGWEKVLVNAKDEGANKEPVPEKVSQITKDNRII